MSDALLSIRDLAVRFPGPTGPVDAVVGVDLDVAAGQVTALVGESGSGKSVTALCVTGLQPSSAVISAGSIRFEGADLLQLSARELRRVRGGRIGMVFQEPLTALNPFVPVGDQVLEAVRLHTGLRGRAARLRVFELLEEVGLDEPAESCRAHTHRLSGGQRQRVMIAMALAGNPALLIADEPTTALDVTVQARILDLFSRLVRERSMALLLISHDLAVVARLASRIAIIRRGRILEENRTESLLADPSQPYTRELLAAIPRIDAKPRVKSQPAAEDVEPLLEARDVSVTYPARAGRRRLCAVDGVSFTLAPGETVALVGESGCGKTTLARALLRLQRAEAGQILLRAPGAGAHSLVDLRQISGAELRGARRHLQAVFQDPYSSLDPRRMVSWSVGEPLRCFGIGDACERSDRIAETLRMVDLDPDLGPRYPHELSGGQRQRVCIARALAPEPGLLVLDEAVSSLDVSLQARIIELLVDLQERLGLSYLFITHDLGVVRALAHRVLVMHSGRIVESASNEDLFARPAHSYTRTLLDSVPTSRQA